LRVLIDTNIFIDREKHDVVPVDLQELLRILAKLKVDLLVHPKSVEEIKKDKNKERRKISLSKIAAYPPLESPPDPTRDVLFLNKVKGSVTLHDRIDNFLLYAVFRDAVSYLITEDKDILKKASRVELRERVFPRLEAREFFRTFLPKERVRHPSALKEEHVHNLNLDDPFFDSLKKEYPDFISWFKKISREGRKCYVYMRKKVISALLILKTEKEAIACRPPLPENLRLKLCTFKSEPSGYRLGELFIKIAARYCVQNNINEMYLTYFPKEEGASFIKLLSEYGFQERGRKTNGESVYLKRLVPDPEICPRLSKVDIGGQFYPSFYDGEDVKKFMIPIRPKYHDRLFDDYESGAQRSPSNGPVNKSNQFNVEGNAISKAYLCHAPITKISEGDLLLFYRSHDRQELTTIGVVEAVYRMNNAQKIAETVSNRTVYSYDEIEEMAKTSTLVLIFRWHFYLPNPIKLERLLDQGILRSAPQTITTIDHKKYLKIKKESKLDGRYTID